MIAHALLLGVLAAAPPPVSLANGLEPLVESFNGEPDRVRMIAVLPSSDTSALLAARALRDVLRDRPEAELTVHLVWIDFVHTDDAYSALAASKMLKDERVRHYHDPERRTALAITRELFPEALPQMYASMSDDHLLASEVKPRLQKLQRMEQPTKEIFLLFSGEAEWGDRMPTPDRWVHQFLSYGPADGLLWVNDYELAPRDGTLEDQLAPLLDEMLETPAPPADTPVPSGDG